ncbi:hypothetical protein FNV43_RR06475 [Rhamnella rubrinervis]|uniref:Uncharacterized protein n=1 Tax=Rhamnella rubrinervis TaxID=2594499 RepID=A0A8K0MLF7_9ROSA|nr:hypothetical protein FNV43_RR06475 [Rhamnella rubrinervis]
MRKSDYLRSRFRRRVSEYWIWKRTIKLETPLLTIYPYGGKMAVISSTCSPFPHRAGNLAKIQLQPTGMLRELRPQSIIKI